MCAGGGDLTAPSFSAQVMACLRASWSMVWLILCQVRVLEDLSQASHCPSCLLQEGSAGSPGSGASLVMQTCQQAWSSEMTVESVVVICPWTRRGGRRAERSRHMAGWFSPSGHWLPGPYFPASGSLFSGAVKALSSRGTCLSRMSEEICARQGKIRCLRIVVGGRLGT